MKQTMKQKSGRTASQKGAGRASERDSGQKRARKQTKDRKKQTSKQKSGRATDWMGQKSVGWLVAALILVVGGGVVFMGAVSGWFDDGKVRLDAEYICVEKCDEELMDLTAEEYERLVEEKKSFVVVIDQGGCVTAERLKEYAKEFGKERGIKIYRMIFSEMKETSLHNNIKYYPSIAVISKGRVQAFLRADSDEDAPEYNDYEEFRQWMERVLN